MENNTYAISMSKMAHKLKMIGRNKLYEFLREQNIMDRQNLPTTEYMDSGFFQINYSPTAIDETPTTYITKLGELFIKALVKVKQTANGNK